MQTLFYALLCNRHHLVHRVRYRRFCIHKVTLYQQSQASALRTSNNSNERLNEVSTGDFHDGAIVLKRHMILYHANLSRCCVRILQLACW